MPRYQRQNYQILRPIDVSFSETLQLINRTAGSRSSTGRWLNGVQTTNNIIAATAPPNDALIRDLQTGGIETEGARMIWTHERLKPTGDDNTGDRVRWNGETYKIHSVKDWGTFFEAIAIREEGQ